MQLTIFSPRIRSGSVLYVPFRRNASRFTNWHASTNVSTFFIPESTIARPGRVSSAPSLSRAARAAHRADDRYLKTRFQAYGRPTDSRNSAAMRGRVSNRGA